MLSIELERQPPRYRPGESIRGEIVIAPKRDRRFSSLTVSPRWRTEGKGEVDEGRAGGCDLGAQEWIGGSTYRLPFQLAAPEGPLSHAGKVASWVWSLSIALDQQWYVGTGGSRVFDLVPWDEQPLLPPAPGYRGEAQRWDGEYAVGTSRLELGPGGRIAPGMSSHWGLIVTCLVGAAAFVMFMGIDDAEGTPRLVMAVATASCLAIAAWGYRLQTINDRRGHPSVNVEPREVEAGDVVNVTVEITPKGGDQRLDCLSAAMAATEQAAYGVQNEHGVRSSVSHCFHSEEHEIATGVGLARGKLKRFEAALQAPTDVATSRRTGNNGIRWHVEVRMELEGFPPYQETQTIVVMPKRY